MECLSPNIHVPDLTAGPKKKRFQVHSACTQCKKSHSACSMTRPCERCVRVGESHLCVDVPRKKRGKQAQSQLPHAVHPIPLDPPSLINGNGNGNYYNNNNNNISNINNSNNYNNINNINNVPEDTIAPIDEISDFLFDGIENNLLTDSNLRNVALLEGSSLSVSTLLHSRPLFSNIPTTSTGSPSYISLAGASPVLSPSTSSSSDVSPVPSPYNNNSSPNDSPAHDITSSSSAYGNHLNHTNNSIVYGGVFNSNGTAANTNSTSPIFINPAFNTNSLGEPHIPHLLGSTVTSFTYLNPSPPRSSPLSPSSYSSPSLSSSPPLSSSSTSSSSSSSTSGNISQQSLPVSQNYSPSATWPENISPLQAVPDTTFSSTPDISSCNPNKAMVPAKSRGVEDLLASFDNPETIANSGDHNGEHTDSNGDCNLPQCFCHKVHRPGKVQLVCIHDQTDPTSHTAKFVSTDPPYNPNASLHLVVESLVREVQSLKRELRGEKPPSDSVYLIGYYTGEIASFDHTVPKGPAVAVWDLVSQKLTECNDTFSTLFGVDRSQPCYLTDIAQCPAYFLRLCAANKTTWHEKRRFSLKRPEGDINLVVAVDINGTCVVTTLWKA